MDEIISGTPTTIGDTERRLEVYLLDIADEDYYGQKLTTRLKHFHRQNQTFAGVDELLKVMKDDESQARQWFAELSSDTDRP